MELSVIIVSFNAKEYLRQCLHSVVIATEEIDSEVFVVDNNSSDESSEMIRNEFPDIHLINNERNSGFSLANNQAIRISSGQFILLLNPDTIVERETFAKCISFMQSHIDAGAIGVKMVDGDGIFLPESKRALPDLRTAFFKTLGFSSLFPKSHFLNNYYLPKVDVEETSLTEVISGAFMFLRREALNKSGLLDEDFFMYGEDIDLSYRLLQTSYNNYYFPEVRIIHFKGKSTPRNKFIDIRHFYKAMRIYVEKRSEEGKFGLSKYLIFTAIFLRELLALLIRFLKLTLTR
jgi:GT2 family glycosyltransferase